MGFFLALEPAARLVRMAQDASRDMPVRFLNASAEARALCAPRECGIVFFGCL